MKQLIQTWNQGQIRDRSDQLADEDPIEIAIDHCDGQKWQRQSIAVTMRSPGEDSWLALGFLLTETIIQSFQDVDEIEERPQRIIVRLKDDVRVDLKKLTRHVFTNSSCGVCSQASLDQVVKQCPIKPQMEGPLAVSILLSLPGILHNAQKEFGLTGGLHASGLFGLDGALLILCEDVGRHNALDKLVGAAMQRDQLPLHDRLLLLSGRASFELIQKAALAGIAFVAALGAPSSLACLLAQSLEMTLVGFLRAESFNVYSGGQRLLLGSPPV